MRPADLVSRSAGLPAARRGVTCSLVPFDQRAQAKVAPEIYLHVILLAENVVCFLLFDLLFAEYVAQFMVDLKALDAF